MKRGEGADSIDSGSMIISDEASESFLESSTKCCKLSSVVIERSLQIEANDISFEINQ